MSIVKNKQTLIPSKNGREVSEIYYNGKCLYSNYNNYPYNIVYRNLTNGVLTNFDGNLSNIFNDIRVIGPYALSGSYNNNAAVSGSVNFPNLVEIREYGMNKCFPRTGLISANFPNLKTIDDYGMYWCFDYCQNITSASFPKLTTIGKYGMSECFHYCAKLSSVNFPSLKTVDVTGLENCFFWCYDLKQLHFRADAKNVITACNGYNDKFGSSDTTIYFDL